MTRPRVDLVAAGAQHQIILPRPPEPEVTSSATDDQVVTATTVKSVRTAEPAHDIVTTQAEDQIRPFGSHQDV
jgi:hypothetical protein